MNAKNERMRQDLIQEITSYQKQLDENGKDLRHAIGDAFLASLHPVWRIFTFPSRLLKLHREFKSRQWQIPEQTEQMSEDNYLEELRRYRDELRSLATLRRSDVRFRIGYEILKAYEFWPRTLALPFILIWVALRKCWRDMRLRMRQNRKKRRKGNSKGNQTSYMHLPPISDMNDCILFVATNGVGLGHLTRCLSVARRVKKLSPDTEIIFLTTSLALTAIRREGFTVYCVPSKMTIKNISSSQWNKLLKNQLMQLMDLYSFKAVVFDGAYPYASISATMAELEGACRVWIKRGCEKPDSNMVYREDAEKMFDYVIVPSEAGDELVSDKEQRIPVPPVIFLNREELWSREDVRRFLHIPEGKKAVYIQLGAGNVNDIDSELGKLFVELRKHDDLIMILGESMIGNELRILDEDVIVIKDYPNSKYFGGFDFAVSACGYNTFHELLYFAVPTIFLPNRNTQTDDQVKRAMIAQDAGAGIVVTDINSDQLKKAVDRMCDETENRRMHENAEKIIVENGADRAARILLELSGIVKDS